MEKKTHDLTIEEVRAMGGYDHLSDEEIQNIIDSLKELSLLLYNIYMEDQTRKGIQ